MVISSRDLVLRCSIVLLLMVRDHGMRHQNLSSGQHALHLAINESPGIASSLSIGIMLLIGGSHRKAVGDVSILERKFSSARIDLAMLNFSFEFHTVLCTFDR